LLTFYYIKKTQKSKRFLPKFSNLFLNYYTKPCIMFKRWSNEKRENNNGTRSRFGR